MRQPSNDTESTIAGLKAQDCPGRGWNGMPAEIERATVADCLAHEVCGCIYGDAVRHIERLRDGNEKLKTEVWHLQAVNGALGLLSVIEQLSIDGYNATDDFAKSIDEAYRVIRERMAQGGPGWRPKCGQ